MSKLIGYLHVDAIKNYRRSYEYAGAGELWDLEAATVPVYVSQDGYWVVYSHPGVCTESWFQNRIGAALGSDNRCTEPKPGSLPRQMSFFHLGTLYHNGKVQLEPDWSAEYCDQYPDGKQMVLIQPKS